MVFGLCCVFLYLCGECVVYMCVVCCVCVCDVCVFGMCCERCMCVV